MNKEQILKRMDLVIKEDRERFFKVADAMRFQPQYAENLAVLDEIVQEWRDITKLDGYPNIDFPLALPDWFPKVHFGSRWKKDEYINHVARDKAEEKQSLEDVEDIKRIISIIAEEKIVEEE